MNGKKAKMLRRMAEKASSEMNLPPVSYEIKKHYKHVPSGELTPDGASIPMVVARLQQVLSNCVRKAYKVCKKQYKEGVYVVG